MKHNLTLTITSLLSILFMTFHLTQDTLHAKLGNPEAGGSTLVTVPVLVVWLYGTLVLAERRSGYVIILIASLLSMGLPVIHMRGAGVGFGTNRRGFSSSGHSSPLGVTALFSVILSARGLWSLRRGQSR